MHAPHSQIRSTTTRCRLSQNTKCKPPHAQQGALNCGSMCVPPTVSATAHRRGRTGRRRKRPWRRRGGRLRTHMQGLAHGTLGVATSLEHASVHELSAATPTVTLKNAGRPRGTSRRHWYPARALGCACALCPVRPCYMRAALLHDRCMPPIPRSAVRLPVAGFLRTQNASPLTPSRAP